MKSPSKPGLPFAGSLYGWEEKGEVPVERWLHSDRVESHREMLFKFLIFFPPSEAHVWKSVECRCVAIMSHLKQN